MPGLRDGLVPEPRSLTEGERAQLAIIRQPRVTWENLRHDTTEEEPPVDDALIQGDPDPDTTWENLHHDTTWENLRHDTTEENLRHDTTEEELRHDTTVLPVDDAPIHPPHQRPQEEVPRNPIPAPGRNANPHERQGDSGRESRFNGANHSSRRRRPYPVSSHNAAARPRYSTNLSNPGNGSPRSNNGSFTSNNSPPRSNNQASPSNDVASTSGSGRHNVTINNYGILFHITQPPGWYPHPDQGHPDRRQPPNYRDDAEVD